uniref:Uncharacterized protein n=1 Tax=Romanomermis culicivorax TaxID=13658 RepID=A0A915J755_ROMCU
MLPDYKSGKRSDTLTDRVLVRRVQSDDRILLRVDSEAAGEAVVMHDRTEVVGQLNIPIVKDGKQVNIWNGTESLIRVLYLISIIPQKAAPVTYFVGGDPDQFATGIMQADFLRTIHFADKRRAAVAVDEFDAVDADAVFLPPDASQDKQRQKVI